MMYLKEYKIMANTSILIKEEKRYTYQDYLHFSDDERWEIINGIVYDMSPAPKTKHQRIVIQFVRRLGDKIEQRGCTLFVAPTDVIFDNFNVVQPDVFVVCDKNKITEYNIQGAPDLIIEVISVSTEKKDKNEKKALYEKFAVQEYVMVFPEKEYVERYCLTEGQYSSPEKLNWNEKLTFSLFNMELNLWEVFEKEINLP